MKLYHYSGENWFIEEWYKKDEKYAIKVRIFNENATVVSGTMEDYYNGETVNSYNETSKKVAFKSLTVLLEFFSPIRFHHLISISYLF